MISLVNQYTSQGGYGRGETIFYAIIIVFTLDGVMATMCSPLSEETILVTFSNDITGILTVLT